MKPPPRPSPAARRWCEDEDNTGRYLHLAPLAGRAQAAFGGRSCGRTPKQRFGYRKAPGEGDSPRVALVDRATHPNPLPAKSGAREFTVVAEARRCLISPNWN